MKTRIKKALNFIKWTWIWILYCEATKDDRMSYRLAKSAGHEVCVRDVDTFGGYVAENRHKPPQERIFRTWEEFREKNNF